MGLKYIEVAQLAKVIAATRSVKENLRKQRSKLIDSINSTKEKLAHSREQKHAAKRKGEDNVARRFGSEETRYRNTLQQLMSRKKSINDQLRK